MPTPVLVRAVLWLWLLAALYLGHEQMLAGLPPLALPAIVAGLAAALLFLGGRLKLVRTWFDQVEPRALVLLHVTRFVGFYFLHLFGRGELPADFAFVSGWGENVIAAAALVLGFAPLKPASRRRVIAWWNVVGLVGIAFLTYNLTRLTMTESGALALFSQLPLNLLPTFLLPLMLATHVLIHRRLEREEREANTPAGDLE